MAYLTGARASVVAFLAAALPTLDVRASPVLPDQLLADCVVVAPTSVTPATVAYAGVVAQLDLFVLSATTIGPGAEDDLEALLDQVLTVLDTNQVTWTRAERSTFQESYPAYRIEMETPR